MHSPSPATERERDALRIQAAAVAAQQAEVAEQENRLCQRQTALQKQEAQLAEHLSQQRQRLARWQTRLRTLRDRLARRQLRLEKDEGEIQDTQSQLTTQKRENEDERRQLLALRRRLLKRYVREVRAARRELEERELRQRSEEDRLRNEAVALREQLVQLNGERELTQRRLREEWRLLRQTQEEVAQQHRSHQKALRDREADLSTAEQTLAYEKRVWDKARRLLILEVEGLENRVLHLRQKALASTVPSPIPPSLPTEPLPSSPHRTENSSPEPAEESLAPLDRLADTLLDQRRHLLEQMERLLHLHGAWEQEQAQALAEVDTAAQRLQVREAALWPREQELAEGMAQLMRRDAEATQRRWHLEAAQSEHTLRVASWNTTHDQHAAALEAREQRLVTHEDALVRLRRRWLARWRAAWETLRTEAQRVAELSEREHLRSEANHQKAEELDRLQRNLAARALALEQHHQTTVHNSANSAATERRIARWQRRLHSLWTSAEKRLTVQGQVLQVERERLGAMVQQILQKGVVLSEHERALDDRAAEADQDRIADEEQRAQRQADVQSLLAERDALGREVQSLRDEVERLARLLLEESSTPPQTTPRAA